MAMTGDQTIARRRARPRRPFGSELTVSALDGNASRVGGTDDARPRLVGPAPECRDTPASPLYRRDLRRPRARRRPAAPGRTPAPRRSGRPPPSSVVCTWVGLARPARPAGDQRGALVSAATCRAYIFRA